MEYTQMTDDNGKDMRLEITQDKLVDILQHAATRQDIADLRVETNSNIVGVKTELKADINRIESKIDSGFKWLMGVVIVGVMIPMVGIFATIALKSFH
tara:strand:+ start:804 stop:1097 length:294 start_codon:yes stop_codon:yes gene_type:complete